MCTAKGTSSSDSNSPQDFELAGAYKTIEAATPDGSNPVDTSGEDDGKPKSFSVDIDGQQADQQLSKRDRASGLVLVGAFAVGSLVGVVISAPAFVVVILGAGAAALCRHDSKAGNVARKVGGFGAKVILGVVKTGREVNERFKVGEKAKQLFKDTGARIQKADEKRGISDNIKARTASLWSHIEQKTRPQQSSVEEDTPEPTAVTDGTELPFGQQTHKTDL